MRFEYGAGIVVAALLCAGCDYDSLLRATVRADATGGAGAGVVDGRGGAAGGLEEGSEAGGAAGQAEQPLPWDEATLDEPLEPGDVEGVDVIVNVRSDDPSRHPISSLIYGIRGNTDFTLHRQQLFSPAEIRWSSYNWENNASNSGYSSNQNDAGLSGSDIPGQAVHSFIANAEQWGARPLVVVPIGSRVAADKFGTDVRDGSVADLSYLETRFVENHAIKATALSLNPDLNDGAVYQDEFLSWLRMDFPDSSPLFALDEEPDLWRTTTPAARPEVLTYEELVQRNIDYGDAIKRSWPSAFVLGLASYGWSGWESLADAITGESPPDADGPFLEYYLSGMQRAEQTYGRRLIDYVDLHWFSEARGTDSSGALVRVVSAADASASAARVQAPRSLWDPDYSEDSWIVNDVLQEPIELIPRIRKRIAATYPGTRLAIASWLFGGDHHISGAIAVADALGIFGREGIDIAALARGSRFALAGFRTFTNFDGAGAHFGDFYIAASTSDVEAVTAYASVDSTDASRAVVVLINKRDVPTSVGIRLAHPLEFDLAECFYLDGIQESIRRCGTISPISINVFRYAMPALSIVVLEAEG